MIFLCKCDFFFSFHSKVSRITSSVYRQLCVVARALSFWFRKIDAAIKQIHGYGGSQFDSLLGRGRMPASDLIDVDNFNRFFAEKVSKVRSNTSDVTRRHSAAFNPSRSRPSPRLMSMTSLTQFGTQQLPDKSSAADPMPNSPEISR